jgi:hypothetical protein
MKPWCPPLLLALSLGALACALWAASLGRPRPSPGESRDDEDPVASLIGLFEQEEPGPGRVVVVLGGGSMACRDELAPYPCPNELAPYPYPPALLVRGPVTLGMSEEVRRYLGEGQGPLELREFHATPWPEVFRWLGEKTGLPVSCPYAPPGSFTLPPGGRRCGVAEFVDLVNLQLAPPGYHLVRRETGFELVARY